MDPSSEHSAYAIGAHGETYEEHARIPQYLGWIILIGFTLFILGWGMLLMMLVRDTPRLWDYGVLPDTPAASIYSSVSHGEAQAQQIAPLPEAQPMSAAGPAAKAKNREGRR